MANKKRSRRNLKSVVIDLDTVRSKDWAMFVCMNQKCFHSFSSEIPRRINAISEMICPKCKSDFFAYWIDRDGTEEYYVHFPEKK